MDWCIKHTDVTAQDSEIHSKSHIFLEHDGLSMEIMSCKEPELHHLGARRVLVDTAHMLRRLAHEMENRADKLF
jgi:hypothetical protein